MYDDLPGTTTGTQSRSIPKAQWQYKAGLIASKRGRSRHTREGPRRR